MNPRLTTTTTVLLAITALGALGACTDNQGSSSREAIEVVSTDDECRVAEPTAESGNLVFDVRNDGSQVTEFYLFGSDGRRVVGEVENIGPGLTRQLAVTASPGEYVTACKPGMAGDGIRGTFTVTETEPG